MIVEFWDQYRGWANRARSLQKDSTRWNRIALLCGVLAAVFAAAAATLGPSGLGRFFTFLAAAAAAITPILGRDILAVKRDAGWITARRVAEAIKSECFRYAAHAGRYSGADRDDAFGKRMQELAEPAVAAGIAPLEDKAAGGNDPRRPSDPIDPGWYRTNRVAEQTRFYAKGQRDHDRATSNLRILGLGTSIAAAILGIAGGALSVSWPVPWIAVLTTVGATVVAYGFFDREKYLGQSYGTMLVRLAYIEAHPEWDVVPLVTSTEDLLEAEHTAWADQMKKTIADPAAAQIAAQKKS